MVRSEEKMRMIREVNYQGRIAVLNLKTKTIAFDWKRLLLKKTVESKEIQNALH